MSGMEGTVIEGSVPAGREQFYATAPFEMPEGVTRIDVSYQYSHQIGSDPHLVGGNTLDIGLFDWRGDEFLNAGFRGWSGSARDHFYVGINSATPGYMPGPMTAGTWYINLGFYKVSPDGCDYSVQIDFTYGDTQGDISFPELLNLQSPNALLPERANGWYKGELHCHSVHSDGDSAPAELIAEAEALGMDFLAITDHNNMTHLADMAKLGVQNLVLIPGCEVTSYSGHWNIWGLTEWVDFRVHSAEELSQSIQFAKQRGWLTSCNHPKQYGPPWRYESAMLCDCVEIWNGPWSFFNTEALEFWEKRIRSGMRLPAVGGSDTHQLKSDHYAKIGQPTTWLYCPENRTASGLIEALRAGHTCITNSPDGPRMTLTAGSAMMGDAVQHPANGQLTVRLQTIGGEGRVLEIHDASTCLHSEPITLPEQEFEIELSVPETPYIRAQIVEQAGDNNTIVTVTNPIYLSA